MLVGLLFPFFLKSLSRLKHKGGVQGVAEGPAQGRGPTLRTRVKGGFVC